MLKILENLNIGDTIKIEDTSSSLFSWPTIKSGDIGVIIWKINPKRIKFYDDVVRYISFRTLTQEIIFADGLWAVKKI